MDTSSNFSSATRINLLVVVVTGDSPLSINICRRMIESTTEDLTFVITATTLKKTQDTISQIRTYARPQISLRRIDCDYLVVDFAEMNTVHAGCADLLRNYPRIDMVFVCHTQYPEIEGTNWTQVFAAQEPYPPFLSALQSGVTSSGLGRIFQCNVLAPYYMVNNLVPALRHGGKVVWFSLAVGDREVVCVDDLQLRRTDKEYAQSQRLIDLVYCGSLDDMLEHGIELYLVQPGFGLAYAQTRTVSMLAYMLILVGFWFRTLMGLVLHTMDPYRAAYAAVHCAVRGDQRDFKVGLTMGTHQSIVYHDVGSVGSEDVAAYVHKLCVAWRKGKE